MSVHRNYFTEKNSLQDSNLPPSILGVLGLVGGRYSHIPLYYIEFRKTVFIPVYLAKTIDNVSKIKLA